MVQIVDARRSEDALAGTGEARGRRDRSSHAAHKASTLANANQMWAARWAPLLITEAGSTWSDLVLNQRAAAGAPTVVLSLERDGEGGGRDSEGGGQEEQSVTVDNLGTGLYLHATRIGPCDGYFERGSCVACCRDSQRGDPYGGEPRSHPCHG